MKVSVYGLGQFGYAIFNHLSAKSGKDFDLYGYDNNPEVTDSLQRQRSHPYLYSNYRIADNVNIVDTSLKLLKGADVVIIAVPSHITRDVIIELNSYVKKGVLLMNTAKAIDFETGKRLSVLFESGINRQPFYYALFAGGTIAKDLFEHQLLGAVIASENKNTALKLKTIMQSHHLKISITDDLTGAEYASAFKNVISILTGIIHGLGFGYGSETYVISRIADEVQKLITTSLGGSGKTFNINSQCWGNDMFMSATGNTRNREYGIRIGKGEDPQKALQTMLDEKKTVEGIMTLQVINKLVKIDNSTYPLLNYLYQTVIHHKKPDLLEVL